MLVVLKVNYVTSLFLCAWDELYLRLVSKSKAWTGWFNL